MEPIADFVITVATWALPVLIAVTLHEAAHGYAAWVLGDPTAKLQGRLSLNPLRHVDIFGTILLPLILFLIGGFIFGYAKPVPVNARNFKNPSAHMAIVAAAGPMANLFLAFVGAILIHVILFMPDIMSGFLLSNIQNFIFLNCLLIVLNMIPLPPLDGSRIIAGILPPSLAWYYSRIEPFGIMILVGLIFILPMAGNIFGLSLNFSGAFIVQPAISLTQSILAVFGFGA